MPFAQRGTSRHWVVQSGRVLPEPFIDLRPEVNGQWDRGLLGIALHTDFLSEHHVYLLYTVDPVSGEPDEPGTAESFARLSRYTGTPASDGNEADPETRLVLIGVNPSEGFPSCHSSHTIGSVRFADDGTLFAGSGDGAHFDFVDDGGNDPPCFSPGLFGRDEDLGAFRAQYLGSLGGKIVRIDAETGLGLPSNPHWTGDGTDKRSKIWVNGLRNPYRFTVKQQGIGAGGPGTLYIGDVGWFTFEEMNVAHGGENFGWPCFEGTEPAPGYAAAQPEHSGCDTVETPENPGPLTAPLVDWHHDNPALSCPPVFDGNAASGAVFYTATTYPQPYRGALFFANLVGPSWIKVLQVDESDGFVGLLDFAAVTGQIVDLRVDPTDGDVHAVRLLEGEVIRFRFDPGFKADINGDGLVNVEDLVQLILAWGPCSEPPAPCPADVDGSGEVDVVDLVIVVLLWG